MKIYEVRLTEQHGEQHYTHYILVDANSEKEAWNMALKIAARWYGDDEDGEPASCYVGNNTYEMDGSGILVSVYRVTETTKKAYAQARLEEALNLGRQQCLS